MMSTHAGCSAALPIFSAFIRFWMYSGNLVRVPSGSGCRAATTASMSGTPVLLSVWRTRERNFVPVGPLNNVKSGPGRRPSERTATHSEQQPSGQRASQLQQPQHAGHRPSRQPGATAWVKLLVVVCMLACRAGKRACDAARGVSSGGHGARRGGRHFAVSMLSRTTADGKSQRSRSEEEGRLVTSLHFPSLHFPSRHFTRHFRSLHLAICYMSGW